MAETDAVGKILEIFERKASEEIEVDQFLTEIEEMMEVFERRAKNDMNYDEFENKMLDLKCKATPSKISSLALKVIQQREDKSMEEFLADVKNFTGEVMKLIAKFEDADENVEIKKENDNDDACMCDDDDENIEIKNEDKRRYPMRRRDKPNYYGQNIYI